VDLGRQNGKLGQGGGACGEQVAAVAGQLGVPERQLIAPGQPLADTLQEVVAVAQNALEDMGAVKPVLKDRPSGGDGSSTDPMQAAIDAAINAPRSTWATERGKPDNSTV